MPSYRGLTLGAILLGEGRCQFRVWAPKAEHVEVHLLSPNEQFIPMERESHGYHRAIVEGVEVGALYTYRPGEQDRPDPVSRCQPQGVFGPSQVVDPAFPWEDQGWPGLSLAEAVFYELHVGTFTPEGTFEAIIPHLDELQDLGINALQLMPVNQFPGERNWGYDGAFFFAPQNSYGGPEGLRKLVNAAHRIGMAVSLDVVYNHLGPEGCWMPDYAPYQTDRYATLWGSAMNFDGPMSDEVRRFFIENALHWIQEYHVDALRLDATDHMLDFSAVPFLQELAATVAEASSQSNRKAYLIAETSRNDARILRPVELGGYGLDAQWLEDFHHVLHAQLTGERVAYYKVFGEFWQLVKAFREGFAFTGEYLDLEQRHHGTSTRDIPASRFVAFSQNHDQVGNRALGDRLTAIVSFDTLKLIAASVIFSPYIPLLFMGEEYGESAPFQYFVDYSDPNLVEAARNGRKKQFGDLMGAGELPDPKAEETFHRSKLDHRLRRQGNHRVLQDFYKELLRLRKSIPALARPDKDNLEMIGYERKKVLFMRRWNDGSEIFAVFNYGDEQVSVELPIPLGRWCKRLDSTDPRWQPDSGAGEAQNAGSLPAEIDGEREIVFTLSPKAVVLFAKDAPIGGEKSPA